MPSSNPGQFTNPWTASPSPVPSRSVHGTSEGLNTNSGLDRFTIEEAARNVSMGSYAGVHGTAAPAGGSLLAEAYGLQDLFTVPQELSSQYHMLFKSSGFGNEATSTTALSGVYGAYARISTVPARSPCTIQQQSQDNSRGLPRPGLQGESTRSSGDTIGASNGMIARSENTTPRDIYEAQGCAGRGSGDSYGFPAAYSTSSSMSSPESHPPYLGDSINSSISDNTKSGSNVESRLPDKGIPPRPSSMMGQFSSKESSNREKRHKCKVCEKRFTRPSSLQTHMYSHTGEKPFLCDAEGCGRHFSVISNLRRHRRVHKGEAPSKAGSKDR